MQSASLDTAMLFALMGAGAVFALAGIWLLLRRSPEGTSKVELFGLKFETSSAGLFVFAVGAMFLGLPVFIGQTSMERAAPPIAERGLDAAKSSELAPARIARKEVEPNNSAAAAHVLRLGEAVSGSVAQNSLDFFRVDVPKTSIAGYSIALSGRDASLAILDRDGEELFNRRLPPGGGTIGFRGHAAPAGVIARVTGHGTSREIYTLVTAQVP
jgi:hypothetical protein